MRTAQISRRQAEASFDVEASEDDIFAAQWWAATSFEREQIARESEMEIDRLIEEVDRELAAEARVEGARLLLDLTDQRRPRRARRRAERVALRALPTQIALSDLLAGEAA